MRNLNLRPIRNELIELESLLNDSISSEIDLATEVSSYLIKSGGKRIRPILCITTGRMLGYKGKELINLSSAIELLHTATLIHDDVVDQSTLRRGKESIHEKWDISHGVLVGDFVYSKAFQLMASLSKKEIIELLANSTNKISEGEVLQLSLKNEKKISEEEYFEIIDRKTGELFIAATKSASILSSANKEQILSIEKFSKALGRAFQVRDDLLDYLGDPNKTGKKIGKDFEEGKLTLPILKILNSISEDKSEELLQKVKKGNKEDIQAVQALMHESGAIKEIKMICDDLSKECLKELQKFPKNVYQELLVELVENLEVRLS